MSPQQQEYDNDVQQKRSPLAHRFGQGRALESGGMKVVRFKVTEIGNISEG